MAQTIHHQRTFGLCAMAGAVSGISVGVLITAYGLATLGEAFTTEDTLLAAGLGTIYAFLVLAYIFFVVGGAKFWPTAWYMLANALIVSALTSLFCYLTQWLLIAWLAGAVIGFIVGFVLCKLRRLLGGG
jgi:hypothetical protein